MTNYGPWSVKGIDQRAREAAREAAREEGLTIGEYINRMLLEETGDEAPSARDETSPRYPRALDEEARQVSAAQARGPINELIARLEAVEARSTMALTGIDQSIVGLLTRIKEADAKADGVATNVEAVVQDIQSTHEALQQKVSALEADKGDASNLDSLKSLERALGKLASHVYDESVRQKDETATVRGRVENSLEDMGARVSGVESRIQSVLSDAAGQLESKVGHAELRAEGAVKHLSGRFSELENTVSSRLQKVNELDGRVSDIRDEASATQRKTDEFGNEIEGFRKDISAFDTRLENNTRDVQSLGGQVENLGSRVGRGFDEIEKLKGHAENTTARLTSHDAKLDNLGHAVETFGQRTDASDQRLNIVSTQLEAIDKRVSGTDDRLSKSFDDIGKLNSRIDTTASDVNGAHSLLKQLGEALGAVDGRAQTRDNQMSRVASDVEKLDDRLTGVSDKVQETSARVEKLGTDVSATNDRTDAATARLEQAENRIRKIKAQVRENTEQTATTAGTVSKAVSDFDAATGRINKLDDDLASTISRLDDAAARISRSEARFDAVDAELKAADARSKEADEKLARVATSIEGVDTRVDVIGDGIETANGRIDKLGDDVAAAAERADATDGTIEGLRSELDQTVSKVNDLTGQLDHVRNDTADRAVGLDATLASLQERLGHAELATNSAMQTVETSFETLTGRIDALAEFASPQAAQALRDQFENRFQGLAQEIRASIEESRALFANEIEKAVAAMPQPETVAGLENSVSVLQARVGDTEETSSRAFERLTEQVARISQGLSKRLKTVEEKDSSAEIARVKADMQSLTSELSARLQDFSTQNDDVIERVTQQINQLADQFETRVDESEQRSATAIEQVGEQVATVAQRLQARQDRSIQQLHDTLEADRKKQSIRLSDALSGVSDRIDEMNRQSSTSLSPVQKAIASLATRLEALEDTDPSQEQRRPETAARPAVATTMPAEEPKAMPAAAPARRTQDDDSFEAGLAFLDDLEDDTSEGASDGLHEYLTDLPDDDEHDPVSALTDWDDSGEETRESDIFTEDVAPPPADVSWGRSSYEEDDDVPSSQSSGRLPRSADANGSGDYLARARQAAMAASDSSGSRGRKPLPGDVKKKSGKSGKAPLIAAVSVIALAAAAAGGLFFLRGLQQDDDRPVVQTTNNAFGASAAPVAEDVVPETEDVIVAEVAGEDASLADADAAIGAAGPVEQVDDSDLEAELFDAPQEAAVDTPAPAAEDAPEAVDLSTLPVIPSAQTMESAAADGDAIAQFMLGQQRLDAGDYTTGPSLIRRAAEQGEPAAQYRLAKLHEKGLGVPRDLEQARTWTERAAEGGNVKAMHDVAVYYAEGEGGPQSYSVAADWFRQAASYGLTDSQYNLAVLYKEGLGVSPDPTEALYWFAVAARQGDTGAPAKVNELSRQMTPEVVQSAQARASAWTAKAQAPAANGQFGPQAWRGNSNEQVKAVQTVLAGLGYEPGPADGMMGSATVAAISAYQADSDMAQTGEITPDLVESLNALTASARG
ncbi:peptidoglycan-binding protein [Henriciella litoralis]|uniref:peptidoglycan-binding protein n=1 Tax=Henriciella litoralis TaxID=568102 RepID=UPI000A02D27D|nr:peptidoglycan-binding protein [Henriciella litoralis]